MSDSDERYNYFVSYFWTSSSGSGFGSTSISSGVAVIDYERVMAIQDTITESNKFKSCVVINWKLFD
jgi:hypothetical protein